MIMIDTLRADRLGAYLSPAGNTPNQDAIAAEGVTFERAITQAPWTQPAIASLFSSCYPGVHKVLDYAHAFRGAFEGTEKIAVFDDRFTTIAESLHDRGYATAGFVANVYIVAEFGFSQGFDHFDTSFANNTTPGSAVNDAAFKWLEQRDPAKPFFVYLHYMDCHGPYDTAPEFLEPLLDRVEQMPNKRVLTQAELKKLQYLHKLPRAHTDPARHQRLFRYQEYWAARYDAGVRQMDHYIGQLRTGLTEMGLWDDTYVIITADHGEALCEHGFWEHGWSTHHTDLHVPLILRWPGVLPAGKRVGNTVRLIDVLPTLTDQLSLPKPKGMQGASLSPYIAGRPPSTPAIAFAEGVKMGAKQKAIYVSDWKLIKTLATGRLQLYNIAQDPLEQNDLAQTHPRQVEILRAALEEQDRLNARMSKDTEVEQVEISPEMRQRLIDLGYIEQDQPADE
jgi:arylsulfatase A-like enzyme